MMARLTYDAVCIFLLKARQRWEDEAQGGNNNKHARHHCYHLRWRHDAADESMMMPMIMMPMMMMLRMMMMIMMMVMKIKGGGWWKRAETFFNPCFGLRMQRASRRKGWYVAAQIWHQRWLLSASELAFHIHFWRIIFTNSPFHVRKEFFQSQPPLPTTEQNKISNKILCTPIF